MQIWNDCFLRTAIVGAVVDADLYEKFQEKLGGISTEEAIRWFVWQVASGGMTIERA